MRQKKKKPKVRVFLMGPWNYRATPAVCMLQAEVNGERREHLSLCKDIVQALVKPSFRIPRSVGREVEVKITIEAVKKAKKKEKR